MKILFVGEFITPHRDEALSNAFVSLGHDVHRFAVSSYVNSKDLIHRIERRLSIGVSFFRLWKNLIKVATKYKPDVIFFRRPVEFPVDVYHRLKEQTSACMIAYWNDDPFPDSHIRIMGRYIESIIPLFDLHITLREVNVHELYDAGAKRVELMRQYYVPALHKIAPLTMADMVKYKCDAIFIGHGEADSRCDYFDAILESGLTLKLGGSNFERHARGRIHSQLLPTNYYSGDDYRKAIQIAGCSLGFYSSLNRDSLSFRVFEIPACGGVLVAMRNLVVTDLFEEGKEAFFFSNPQELIDIIAELKNNPGLRNLVAKKGNEKLLADHHEVTDRAKQILSAIKEIIANR